MSLSALPVTPTGGVGTMTEDQIERRAEWLMDGIDRLLMDGEMSQNEYDATVRRLDDWTKQQHALNRGGV